MVNNTISEKVSNFIDRHKNTPAVIVGSAEDIENFPYKTFEGLVFGMGDSPLRGVKLFQTDYWVFANAHWLRPWIQRDINAIKYIKPTATFIATSIFAFQEPKTVKEKIEIALREGEGSLVFFDQRHSKGRSCYAAQGCCVAKDLLGIDRTVQELLSERFNRIEQYSEGATVALQALALAILMGCNPISIVGVKIPRMQKDYTYYKTPEVDKLIRAFGSMGPYLEKDQNMFYARVTHKTRHIAKVVYKMLQNKILPLALKRRFKTEDSIFSPDRMQIKSDFEFIVSNYLQMGGEIRNYSKDSLLSEIEGVLNV